MQILTKKILPGKKCCHYFHIFGFSLTIIVLMFIWWWKKKTQQFSKYKSNHGNPRGCLGRLLHRSSILLFVFKRTWGSRLLSCCPVVTSSGPDSDCTKPHPAILREERLTNPPISGHKETSKSDQKKSHSSVFLRRLCLLELSWLAKSPPNKPPPCPQELTRITVFILHHCWAVARDGSDVGCGV